MHSNELISHSAIRAALIKKVLKPDGGEVLHRFAMMEFRTAQTGRSKNTFAQKAADLGFTALGQ
ncbi:hypothetical protein CH339_23055 [Rhodobium orientis]|uniref:Uncharacterized protein n=1 Tax=Rhodobium orientis TaxID=34017 RepID=A0A327JGC6_9HYPH|nr:hypothetical protein [Rhodobium orientis]RAI23852.1 hypothetical protein CH339_23055 [Rhodobium orientis]